MPLGPSNDELILTETSLKHTPSLANEFIGGAPLPIGLRAAG